MIILDLSKANRSKTWPDNMPMKIRLTQGKYKCDYDLHPMVRNTEWYKELARRVLNIFPHKRDDWPVGINYWEIEHYGAKLIRTENAD